MQHTQVAPVSRWGVDINQFVCLLDPSMDSNFVIMTDFSIVLRNELDSRISYYWHLGFPDTKVADHALDHFDHNVYGLRYCVRHVSTNLKANADN